MAALAVAGEVDALLGVQQVHVAQIVGHAVGVGVGGLAPFGVRLLVAVTAVLRGGKELRIDELTGRGLHVRRQEELVRPEPVGVSLGGLGVVRGAGFGVGVRLLAGVDRERHGERGGSEQRQQERSGWSEKADDLARLKLAQWVRANFSALRRRLSAGQMFR
jgi:hypothetical protein